MLQVLFQKGVRKQNNDLADGSIWSCKESKNMQGFGAILL